ncbi:MAG: MAPEG family protein [Hyphomicrobiales bacterium]|nr:MAPEG family protein [Hyphomicrobiales bacterium]MBV9051505.1 MAPEG family protein [Hyphomicrobiales bacterium]MBV9975252.1 MAPEG family protein [Hyphomicrobiales bacterium]
MTLQAVLAPLFVQVALTFGLLFWLAPLRVGALRRNEVAAREIALGEKAWPPRLQKIANSLDNQFQLPVLFYVLVILAILARKTDLLFVIMSWLFVISRYAHTLVHTGSNDVRVRGPIYGLGLIILVLMWIIFAVRVLLG